ncbi:hypothetical protein V1281_006686 [Nitrobacteraceae bacterium AZCC 2161]
MSQTDAALQQRNVWSSTLQQNEHAHRIPRRDAALSIAHSITTFGIQNPALAAASGKWPKFCPIFYQAAHDVQSTVPRDISILDIDGRLSHWRLSSVTE